MRLHSGESIIRLRACIAGVILRPEAIPEKRSIREIYINTYEKGGTKCFHRQNYDHLFQDTCPSWLYPLTCGATSSWERWDSIMPNGEVYNVDDGPKDMVSFNHYAYGAIGNWLYTRIGGLTMLEPGYKKFRIAPVIGNQLDYAEVSHRCPYGVIFSKWEKCPDTAKGYTLTFTVPAGNCAVVLCPDGVEREFTEGQYTIS